MKNRPEIKIFLTVHFWMDFSGNPRPFYNSNMAKIYIVEWSQNLLFMEGSVFSGIPNYLEYCFFNAILKSGVRQKKRFVATKIEF